MRQKRMIAWFSIAPDDGSGSYSKHVAAALRMIEEGGLRFRLGAMGIEVEDRRNDVFALLARCHAAPSTAPGVHRTSTVIKIDDRIGVDWERWSARSAPSSC
jgi:uncharacterized protein YqgV (UPF0045/DUF77 family)